MIEFLPQVMRLFFFVFLNFGPCLVSQKYHIIPVQHDLSLHSGNCLAGWILYEIISRFIIVSAGAALSWVFSSSFVSRPAPFFYPLLLIEWFCILPVMLWVRQRRPPGSPVALPCPPRVFSRHHTSLLLSAVPGN